VNGESSRDYGEAYSSGTNIIGSGTALTNLNYNAITNPPSLISFSYPSTFVSTLNVSENTTLNNITTCRSTLNVSGNTTLNNATTSNSLLNVVGNIIGSGTAFTNLNYNAILNPPTLISLNNPSTFESTLNVSGATTNIEPC
jgi:hypothetical protein